MGGGEGVFFPRGVPEGAGSVMVFLSVGICGMPIPEGLPFCQYLWMPVPKDLPICQYLWIPVYLMVFLSVSTCGIPEGLPVCQYLWDADTWGFACLSVSVGCRYPRVCLSVSICGYQYTQWFACLSVTVDTGIPDGFPVCQYLWDTGPEGLPVCQYLWTPDGLHVSQILYYSRAWRLVFCLLVTVWPPAIDGLSVCQYLCEPRNLMIFLSVIFCVTPSTWWFACVNFCGTPVLKAYMSVSIWVNL